MNINPNGTSLVRTNIFQKYIKIFQMSYKKVTRYKVVSRLRIVSGVFEFFSPY